MSGLSWRFLATLMLLASTWGAVEWHGDRRSAALGRALASMPLDLAGWQGREGPRITADVLAVLKPSSYLSRIYQRGARQAEVLVAYYERQRAGESMHSPKHCLPGSGWEIYDSATVEVMAAGGPVRVNKYVVENGGTRLILLYWYQTRERIIVNEYWGKVCLVWDALVQGDAAGSIVRVSVADQPGAMEEVSDVAARLIEQMRISLASRRS